MLRVEAVVSTSIHSNKCHPATAIKPHLPCRASDAHHWYPGTSGSLRCARAKVELFVPSAVSSLLHDCHSSPVCRRYDWRARRRGGRRRISTAIRRRQAAPGSIRPDPDSARSKFSARSGRRSSGLPQFLCRKAPVVFVGERALMAHALFPSKPFVRLPSSTGFSGPGMRRWAPVFKGERAPVFVESALPDAHGVECVAGLPSSTGGIRERIGARAVDVNAGAQDGHWARVVDTLIAVVVNRA